MGRKCKLTPHNREVMLELLREGCTHRAAYGAARINRETFYNYLRTKPDFMEDVREAEAVAEHRLVQEARAQKSSARLLSLRFKEDWAERMTLEHEGRIQVEYVNDWRSASDASSGAADSEEPGEEVQLASGGSEVEEDDPLHVHCG